MPNKRELELNDVQRETLEAMRDHHPKPHMREKAAALLKIAGGQSINEVAEHGLLKARNWKTVARWVDRYEATGLGGLYIAHGRGRPAAFSP